MKLLRQLEMRIEAMLDGAAARVFRGPLHPMEMVARIMREADLGSRPGEFGLLAPNRFDILANPDECPDPADSAALVKELGRLVEESVFERGWRLDGSRVGGGWMVHVWVAVGWVTRGWRLEGARVGVGAGGTIVC